VWSFYCVTKKAGKHLTRLFGWKQKIVLFGVASQWMSANFKTSSHNLVINRCIFLNTLIEHCRTIPRVWIVLQHQVIHFMTRNILNRNNSYAFVQWYASSSFKSLNSNVLLQIFIFLRIVQTSVSRFIRLMPHFDFQKRSATCDHSQHDYSPSIGKRSGVLWWSSHETGHQNIYLFRTFHWKRKCRA